MSIDKVMIRRAALSDVEELQALIQRAYRSAAASASWSHEGELPSGERVSCDTLAGLIRSAASMLSVAELGGRLVGTSLVEHEAPRRCRIGLLSVEPGLQGRGIGDQLLQNAEKEAMDSFAARLACIEVLDHKPKLIAYYRRRGYQPTRLSRPYPHRLTTRANLLIFMKRLNCRRNTCCPGEAQATAS